MQGQGNRTRDSSSNVIRVIKSRRMRWAGHVVHVGVREVQTGFRVERSEGKKQLGIPRRRWEDNVKMDLKEFGWDGVD